MPTCLVTGGAGFIGSHLATALVGAGWRVRVYDDLSTGKRENIAEIADAVDLVVGDVLDGPLLAKMMAGIEVVFHLAAKVSVPESVVDPETFHQACAGGTMAVLAAARQAGVRRLVYSGSCSCYGETDQVPTTEATPLAPMSPYAAAKLAGEHYCEAFAAISKLQTVRLRYFNVFGPRQDPSSPYSGVISIFCSKLLAGERPTIYGDGLQTRDFVYVADIVQANLKAAEADGASGRAFNIGSGVRSTLLQLFDSLRRHLDLSIEPILGPSRTGDIRHSRADITAARAVLGYEPTVSLDEGLGHCLEHYRTAVGK